MIGAMVGAVIALLALIVSLISVAGVLLSGTPVQFDESGVLVYYVGGFLIGGGSAGALWPVRRWIGGYYGQGVVMMSGVMFAVAFGEEGLPSKWDPSTWVLSMVLGILFGVALGYGASRIT